MNTKISDIIGISTKQTWAGNSSSRQLVTHKMEAAPSFAICSQLVFSFLQKYRFVCLNFLWKLSRRFFHS